MKHYAVITPEYLYTEYVPGLEPPGGPSYPAVDVVYVEAPNRREARKLAIKMPQMRRHVDDCRSDGVPPFKGLRVEDCLCSHGFCWCEIPGAHPDRDDYCEKCIAEMEEERDA